MGTIHTPVHVLMVIKGLLVMVSPLSFLCLFVDILLCFFIPSTFPEINPACENTTCQNGGSCTFINETHNAVCICDKNFIGKLCEGTGITHSEILRF